MVHIHVTYRIRPDRIPDAESEISAFARSLQRGRPRFESYQILRHANDRAAYIHVIAFKNHEAQLEHTQLPHVKGFVENMLGLCAVGPVYTELESVTTMR